MRTVSAAFGSAVCQERKRGHSTGNKYKQLHVYLLFTVGRLVVLARWTSNLNMMVFYTKQTIDPAGLMLQASQGLRIQMQRQGL